MDTFLAIASRREVRSYDGRPIPADVVRRILDAGRLSGSVANRQPWRFVLLSAERRRRSLRRCSSRTTSAAQGPLRRTFSFRLMTRLITRPRHRR
jgi:nitroreductase